MRFSKALHIPWRLLVAALLVAAFALAGPGARAAGESAEAQPRQAPAAAGAGAGTASAAPARIRVAARPLQGCAPCISSLTPPQNGTVKADASGKVTLQFGAQMTSPFVQFVLTIDGTAVDSSKIQIISNDPLNPVGEYTAVLTPGQHVASVEVDDANGAESTFVGWAFTVQSSQTPTPTPKTQPAGGSGATSSGTTSGGILAPATLSIILFSIAGLGLLVMAFIAGMWFNGRRALRNEP